MKITIKALVLFIACGLLLSALVGIAISLRLAKSVSEDVQNRTMNLIFDSIEAGPLAFARLHSGAIANDQLMKLMSTSGLVNRGILRADILGGDAFGFHFATWISNETADSECIKSLSKNYTFFDAVNPYRVEISFDSCKQLNEARSIAVSSYLAIFLMLLICSALLLLAMWPLFSDIKKAENFLLRQEKIGLENIHLLPMENLIKIAVFATNTEKQVALAKTYRQVAHDIRSPLTVLKMVDLSSPLSGEYKQIVQGAIKRVNDIANDLLNKSNERKGLALSESSFDLPATIQSLIEEKRIEFAKKTNLIFQLDNGTKQSSIVSGEQHVFLRALSNLVNNAVESIDGPGVILIAIRQYGANVSLSISDNGKGIDHDVLLKLGKQEISSGKSYGTGIGFLHAKQIISEMSGKIEIQSKLAVGTIVTITLPSQTLVAHP